MNAYDPNTLGYVNSCGSLTLGTGKSKYFNVIEWNQGFKDQGVTGPMLILFGRRQAGYIEYRVVGGFGLHPAGQEGILRSASNRRVLGQYTVIGAYPANKGGLEAIKKETGQNTISFGTWD